MNTDIKDLFRFFFDHGGGWVGHQAEGALRAAKAYKRAGELGFSVTWEPDDDSPLDNLGDHEYWCNDARAGRRHDHEVLGAIVKDSEGRVYGSLWGIIDPDSKHMKIVEADLYQEALEEYDKREASRCPTCGQVREGV